MTDKAFSSVLSVIKEGMSEKELSVKLQNLLLELGGEKNAFDPIVSFVMLFNAFNCASKTTLYTFSIFSDGLP